MCPWNCSFGILPPSETHENTWDRWHRHTTQALHEKESLSSCSLTLIPFWNLLKVFAFFLANSMTSYNQFTWGAVRLLSKCLKENSFFQFLPLALFIFWLGLLSATQLTTANEILMMPFHGACILLYTRKYHYVI